MLKKSVSVDLQVKNKVLQTFLKYLKLSKNNCLKYLSVFVLKYIFFYRIFKSIFEILLKKYTTAILRWCPSTYFFRNGSDQYIYVLIRI